MSSWDGDHPLDDVAAYALDALDPAEQRAVETHLARCPACRAKLDAERATLACLVTPVPPPATVWHRIAPHLNAAQAPRPDGRPAPSRDWADSPTPTRPGNGAIPRPLPSDQAQPRSLDQPPASAEPDQAWSAFDRGPAVGPVAPASGFGEEQAPQHDLAQAPVARWAGQQSQVGSPDGRVGWHRDRGPERERTGRYRPARDGQGRGGRRLVLAAAAVVVAVVGGFGLGRWAGERGSDQPGLVARAEAAAANPGSTVAELSDASGQPVARVVVDGADGTDAYVLLDDLDRPAAGQTHQLWHLDSTQPVSLGVLSAAAADGAVAVHLPPGVSRLAITVEPAAGVAMPSGPVVARGSVPSR